MTDNALKFDLFPTTELSSPTGNITVPCEPIASGIAITPYLDLGEGVYQLGGGFAITHTPSGKTFVHGQACIECARSAARQLGALDVDWTTIDPTDKGTMQASLGEKLTDAGKALRPFTNCVQQVCAVSDDGELETCEACGFTGTHAPYCIQIVGPMVAELNAKAVAR
jgi:hypothetical protein